jgi:hypothetical protein
VNADDFAMSAEINRAIVEAFHEGVISSTTLITNMPGFEEACEPAHRYRLLGKIGLHLNLDLRLSTLSCYMTMPAACDDTGAAELAVDYRTRKGQPSKPS